MADRQRVRPVSGGLPVYALLAVSVTGLFSTEAAALPPVGPPVAPAAGVILIEDPAAPAPGAAAPAGASQERSPFADLNDALAAARARLQELSKAATVAAAAGQLRKDLEATRQENQQLRAELTALRAQRDQEQQASQGSETRIAELSKAATDAAADAKRIEAELATMRWQNAQLNTSLARAQTAREQAETEARKAQDALSAKVETLNKAAQQSATETARLQTALADAGQRLEVATSARSEADARLAKLQATVQGVDAKSARAEEELAALRGQLAQAQGERDQAQKRVAELAPEVDRLHAALASSEAEVGQVAASKHDLEQEVAQLRAAAGSAADAARQNLLAVEDRIKELNAALGTVAPAADAAAGGAAGAPKTIPAVAPSASQPSPAQPSPPQLSPPLPPPGKASPPVVQVAATARTDAATVDADLDLVKSAPAGEPPLDRELMRLTATLPLEKRLQVEGLLVDLGAKVEPQGLALMVPGEGLFATNSDQIEPTANDTLAKVAELINAYDDHQVKIVGYTDAIGDASYNKVLSQRRANLVKQFFIDNFDINGARLSTEGRGEEAPIASNDTLTGRQANRRVEVLILK